MDHTLAVVLAGKAIELLHGSDILDQPRRLEFRVLLPNIITGEACVPRDPPGEKGSVAALRRRPDRVDAVG
jgi:hypothetical protein